ncbi:AMP-binding protein [Arthrobacter sp. zg-Y820]|uniref:AMP-binding protein n=1 Tax=unclassified Arthrobacter TaxID=235627 RepID=UPI001E2FFB4E|nr:MULTISPECIES: AMP-binding protein [unclassified Arthrobacter]MCC9196534.1 AMP-binding protein [Arthrobacter sp. zg-Y820]MDK1279396.1 AMP-binding protein [Arthrobacter sp. zg.Y820]WIB08222.1 AMP-binding protein [Arthrobacter sp. zg-Y820]
MNSNSATNLFRAARDELLTLAGSYEKAVETFVWPQLDGPFNWAIDYFDAMARGNSACALWIVEEDGSEQKYSFDDMVHRSDQVAAWLAAQGVGRGDPVMLMLGNQVELWETMLAAMKLGAVIMPTASAAGSADLADRISRGGARWVIANAADAGKFDAVPGDYGKILVGAGLQEESDWLDYGKAYAASPVQLQTITDADDPLLFYFTSGTTSRPKLVEHTQVSYPVGHLSTMYFLGLQPGDVHLNISSPGWAKHAWSSFFAPWNAEATVFIHNYTRFRPEALLEQMHRAEVTSLCAPPTVWRMMIQASLGERPAQLRELIGAGEPLNPEVISRVQSAWGLSIRDGFGQTETTALVGNTPGADLHPGSMGRPLPGVPVVIIDPATGLPADEGEICLDLARRPLNLMTGYHGDPVRTEEAMDGGYFHTGDMAVRDAGGYITYIGRTDDVFKASDYKVSPFELESVLIEHPAVAEAAVVPAPDELRLAVPKAYVALAEGWEPNRETALSILSYAREHLAPYLRVRRLEFHDLPKTMSGKIRRVQLRALENDADPARRAERAGVEYRDDEFPELRR